MGDSDSDSDPVGKPAKAGKKKPKVAKAKQPEPELKEDEDEKLTGSDGEEKEKYKKVPCNMCGRQMANEFVLQYHLVRCPGAKKRQSVDSPSAAAGDPERKKAKKDLVETEKPKIGIVGKKGGDDVKKIDNTKSWGGDLKDIYTDRRKKKVDYLEVSDIEESDGDGDDGEEEKKKKNLNKESRISSTSDDDSDKEENLQKKKIIEKKPQKKEGAVEKKRKTASQPKSIAVQIFKGKRKEE